MSGGDNFRMLFEFREKWRHLADPRLREIQRFVLPATVEFTSSKFNQTDQTIVTINCRAGPSDGCISLEETHVLNLNFLHLDFDPRYQDYRFERKSGHLTIHGNSPKMGGDYTVQVRPGEDA